MNNHRFMYVRNSKQQFVGLIAVSLDKKKKKINYQYSAVHSNDTFNADTGKLIALGRLVKNPFQTSYKAKDKGHQITARILKEIILSGSAPNKVVKFAKTWLKNHVPTKDETTSTPKPKKVKKKAAPKSADLVWKLKDSKKLKQGGKLSRYVNLNGKKDKFIYTSPDNVTKKEFTSSKKVYDFIKSLSK